MLSAGDQEDWGTVEQSLRDKIIKHKAKFLDQLIDHIRTMAIINIRKAGVMLGLTKCGFSRSVQLPRHR